MGASRCQWCAGVAKPSRTTSIAAPLSLKILPHTPLKPSVHSSPEEPEYEPAPAPTDPTAEEVEAEVVCAQLESQLAGANYSHLGCLRRPDAMLHSITNTSLAIAITCKLFGVA